jgi:hypothetical protein
MFHLAIRTQTLAASLLAGVSENSGRPSVFFKGTDAPFIGLLHRRKPVCHPVPGD